MLRKRTFSANVISMRHTWHLPYFLLGARLKLSKTGFVKPFYGLLLAQGSFYLPVHLFRLLSVYFMLLLSLNCLNGSGLFLLVVFYGVGPFFVDGFVFNGCALMVLYYFSCKPPHTRSLERHHINFLD